jgi:DNA-directed RNA polymerase alpha subunit
MLHLNESIDNLYFSIRVENVLKLKNIKTVSDLISCTRYDLLRSPNFGKKSLKEVEDALDQHGLWLSNGRPPDFASMVEAGEVGYLPWYIFCH